MEIINTLESLTKQIYSSWEKKSLRKIASEITKVPDTINMPTEYMVNLEGESK